MTTKKLRRSSMPALDYIEQSAALSAQHRRLIDEGFELTSKRARVAQAHNGDATISFTYRRRAGGLVYTTKIQVEV